MVKSSDRTNRKSLVIGLDCSTTGTKAIAVARKVHSLVAIGGGAATDLWCHIFADVTGKSICLPKNTEASALGAAIAAAVGAGWYRSFREAANAMTGVRKTNQAGFK